jgi:hypothetical protein
MPPAAPPLAPPAPTAWIGPSEGCTRTQPWPVNWTWKVSPDPRPISVFMLTSDFTEV